MIILGWKSIVDPGRGLSTSLSALTPFSVVQHQPPHPLILLLLALTQTHYDPLFYAANRGDVGMLASLISENATVLQTDEVGRSLVGVSIPDPA